MTFSALARQYLRSSAADGQAARTGANYDETFALFVEYLHGQDLADEVRQFTPENVEGFKLWLAEQPTKRQGRTRKATAINNRLCALSSLGKWATKVTRPVGTRLPVNPASSDFVARPKQERPIEKFLYREELDAFLRVEAIESERLAADAFFDTAARVSEHAHARVKDLAPNGDALVLHGPVKGGRREAWPLSPELSARLQSFLKKREAGPDDPVFVNQQGRVFTRTTLTGMIQRLALRAGITRIPVTAHVLRHTYNVYARAAGLDPVQRAKLLKHANTATITRYDHLLPGEEIEARARVKEALRG